MSRPQSPGRPHLHVVKGGREASDVVEVDADLRPVRVMRAGEWIG